MRFQYCSDRTSGLGSFACHMQVLVDTSPVTAMHSLSCFGLPTSRWSFCVLAAWQAASSLLHAWLHSIKLLNLSWRPCTPGSSAHFHVTTYSCVGSAQTLCLWPYPMIICPRIMPYDSLIFIWCIGLPSGTYGGPCQRARTPRTGLFMALGGEAALRWRSAAAGKPQTCKLSW
jgi:hypothetical protein